MTPEEAPLHESTDGAPTLAGAAWRQQALRVVRTPENAVSALPTGTVTLVPERTFAQHGVLGDPDALVLSFEIVNAGRGVAPLVDVAVSFAVPAILFDEDDVIDARWQEGGEGWTVAVARIGDTAQITLSARELVRDGGVVSGAFRVRLRAAADLRRLPLEVVASGYVNVPDRPARGSALAVPVERLEL